MYTKPNTIRDLGPVAQAILDHVLRYRLSVPSALVRVTDQLSRGDKNPTTPLQHLIRAKYLGVDVLYDPERYWFLTPDGARACGQALPVTEERWCGPMPEGAKIVNYAILAFCCLGETRRQRLTLDDFQQHFADLVRPGLPMNYYVDVSGDRPRLGFVRVDMGGRGRWDRVLARCCDDWRAHEARPGFRRLMERREFEITVVTALEQKARRLRDALSAQNHGMTVRTCAVPQLLNLIAPPPK